MKCPFCGAKDTQVKDSRSTDDDTGIRRRRECAKCKTRFSTIEKIIIKNIYVVKKNGESRPFDREKINRSINIAFRKRHFPPERLENIVNQIISKIESLGTNEVPSKTIGDIVLNVLSEIDPVAYVRFASVYKEFSEIQDFEKFLHKINTSK
ncbi:MAG: transcriptional regulator NrdR [Alphaproteobacteria bacterium 33-17]|nr:MAG: transcriptional regulator NrdR [Alphaproteobacteria bacterium 33-17]